MWIKLAVGSFQINVRHQSWSTMPRPGDVDHVQIMRFDQTVEMHIDEIQTWCCAPVPKQSGFYMLKFQWLSQERIVEQIDLSDRKIIRRPPIGVHGLRLFRSERFRSHFRNSHLL